MNKIWDTFELLGRFQIHTYPAPAPPPSLTPQTMLDACFQNFFPSLSLKDRINMPRRYLAHYIIPHFKADISLFPTGDRLTQISLYISLLHHD